MMEEPIRPVVVNGNNKPHDIIQTSGAAIAELVKFANKDGKDGMLSCKDCYVNKLVPKSRKSNKTEACCGSARWKLLASVQGRSCWLRYKEDRCEESPSWQWW